MTKEMPEKNWREWSRDTTDRGGRERDLEDYEGYLGFRREELNGKTILDLGSGETELFSKELKESDVDAKVISLNPDYLVERYRKTVKNPGDWQKKSIAGIGQELPFKNESFDRVFALYSVAVFASPRSNPEAAKKWMSEIVRVLKPGGEARLGGILADTKKEVFKGQYKELIEALQKQGMMVEVERVKSSDLGLGGEEEELWDARMIIRKPSK